MGRSAPISKPSCWYLRQQTSFISAQALGYFRRSILCLAHNETGQILSHGRTTCTRQLPPTLDVDNLQLPIFTLCNPKLTALDYLYSCQRSTMCIVLLTTAHPDYALIAIDNRDEFVLRPTSRPHWWTPPNPSALMEDTPSSTLTPSDKEHKTNSVLSSRDLFRAEQGTWLGITKTGVFAVLTNFREPMSEKGVAGARSRGGMVKAWLGGLPDEEGGLMAGVRKLVEEGEGVKNVGGFSMVCGKLRRKACECGEGIAIVSNRVDEAKDVPVIGKERNGVWGLSNAVYSEEDGEEWPKVKIGKRLLENTIAESVEKKEGKKELVERLFGVLDEDTLGDLEEEGRRKGLTDMLDRLRDSVFIRRLGDEDEHWEKVREMKEKVEEELRKESGEIGEKKVEEKKEQVIGKNGFDKGLYGTQRQTVVLVDWEGKVTFVERALWDEWGNNLNKGEGDVVVEFEIEDWNE
ncbi:hypothetical protein NLU13_9931 [Sarocladium strictum]|uniref:Uncharacterized protein n=1 Tax=Sarocladium strictum TaxID=5046 RepID=A0AA39G975_SARSR|nr:hypothetical protein NLU13_9931 [Sarocladium strictum]